MKWLGCLYLSAAALPQLFARTLGLRCRKYYAAPTQSCGFELATPESTIAALRLARDAGRGAGMRAAAGVAAAARIPAPPEI